jgi:uncharacterized phage infection (PIP) family protein YhgE
MTSLDNILAFIEKKNISIRQFEAESELANGTLNENKKRGADLSSKNIEKISKRYGSELLDAGYYVLDLKSFGRDGYAIVKQVESNISEENAIKEEAASIANLSRALADQAAANKIQASANDKHAEGHRTLAEAYKEMLELLRDMRKSLAQQTDQLTIKEKVQANEAQTVEIKSNLNQVQKDVTTLLERQEASIDEFRDQFLLLKGRKTGPSKGARKKHDQSDGI